MITIAHPEPCSGELKTGQKQPGSLFQGEITLLIYFHLEIFISILSVLLEYLFKEGNKS